MKTAGKVKKLMGQHDLTQAQLAKKAGISQNSVFKIANGTTKNSRHLPVIAGVFGVQTEDLLDDSPLPLPETSPDKQRLIRKIKNADDSSIETIEAAIDAITSADNVKQKLGI